MSRAQGLTVSTFHTLGMRILREEHARIRLPSRVHPVRRGR